MLSNNQSKHVRALSVKKYRLEHGEFIVEGDKMVSELLGQSAMDIVAVFALQPWIEKNARPLRHFPENIHVVSEAELAKISALKTPNQVLAVAKLPQTPCPSSLALDNLCFYLDGIQDPGNMGSILRVADWFGFTAVFCSPDCVDAFSPKVVQASMGALFRVQTREIELPELLLEHPDMPVSGAVLDGENVFNTELPSNGLLVIGNEGRGISLQVGNLLTHRISIPRHPLGGAESLNAAIAAGILAAAFRR